MRIKAVENDDDEYIVKCRKCGYGEINAFEPWICCPVCGAKRGKGLEVTQTFSEGKRIA